MDSFAVGYAVHIYIRFGYFIVCSAVAYAVYIYMVFLQKSFAVGVCGTYIYRFSGSKPENYRTAIYASCYAGFGGSPYRERDRQRDIWRGRGAQRDRERYGEIEVCVDGEMEVCAQRDRKRER